MKKLRLILMIAITATMLACGSKKENSTEDTGGAGNNNNAPTDTDTVHLRADTVIVDTTIME